MATFIGSSVTFMLIYRVFLRRDMCACLKGGTILQKINNGNINSKVIQIYLF